MTTTALKAAATGDASHVAAAAAAAGKDPVISALTNAMSKIRNVLPKLITPERMLRIVTNELRINKKLAEAARKNPASLVNAVCVAARCGLEIGGPNPQGHLVPHGDEVVFYPDYRGKLDLMRRSNTLASFSLEPVYENDIFEMKLGFEPSIDHKPFLKGPRGQFMICYFAATLTSGEKMLVWMGKEQIEHIRKKSKMGNSGAWVSDWEEMAKKTVVHRASKIMPQSAELRIVTAAEDALDAGKTVKLDDLDADVIETTGTLVDNETGEIHGEAERDPTQDIPGAGDAPTVDDVALLKRLENGSDIDALDADASLIGSIEDADRRNLLSKAYTKRRKELVK